MLMNEVVDNTIDEYILSHGNEVQIKIDGTERDGARLRARYSACPHRSR